jgi:hypothetical protein
MSALSEVIAELRAALDTMATARLRAVEARERLADALTTFRWHTTGSSQRVVPQAIASFEAGLAKIDAGIATLDEAEYSTRRYLDHLVGPVSRPATTKPTAPLVGPSRPYADAGWAAIVGREIDPIKNHVTSGIVFDDDGNRFDEIFASGERGTWFRKAEEFLRASPRFPAIKPMPVALPPTSHVETQVAIFMRERGISHLTVVINSLTVWTHGSQVPYELKGASDDPQRRP